MKRSEVRRINDYLRQGAMMLGMCQEGKQEWQDFNTLDELCEFYHSGIEFIINHPGYPDGKWLFENVGKPVLEAHGIFYDAKVNVGNPKQAVFNGKSKGRVLCEGFSAPSLYVRHDSDIDVTINDASIVHINVYDNARVNVHCSKFANCHIYQYGGKVKYDGEGKVIVRDKRRKSI